MRRLPIAWWACTGLEISQLALLLLVGAISHTRSAGILFMGFLLLGLARRWRLAWIVLIWMNGVSLLAPLLALGGGGQALWTNVAVLVLTSAGIEIALLSRSMRDYLSRASTGPLQTAL